MSTTGSFSLSGKIADLMQGKFYQGTVNVVNGRIASITPDNNTNSNLIIPGLIDAHVHIESSMLIPSEFARLAVVHGTTATVSDPHEIANVLGIDGVEFMICNGKKVPFRFYFGAPSCVPATGFETSGAVLGVQEMENLMSRSEILYMAEMMNYPGVLFKDETVMAKLEVAKKYNKPVDGHAPGLKGEQARSYIESGITTDHECFTLEEALDKIRFGMKVQIREGSAAKNFDALIPLLDLHPEMVLFCSDDKHPDDLIRGHINLLVKKAIALGYDPMRVLQSAILNPVKHYKLDAGLLQVGDPADMVVIDNLHDFNVLETYVGGELVAAKGKTLIKGVSTETPNSFVAAHLQTDDIYVADSENPLKIIKAIEGQLITDQIIDFPASNKGALMSCTEKDYLKIVVLNRYKPSKPVVGFIHGFGLKTGALASTVAHDSHNIIAVGVEDDQIVEAINAIIDAKGGIVALSSGKKQLLPLPVAGLMSADDGYKVAADYELIDGFVKEAGCKLHAPFMTLSFMALLVIPKFKISDLGLFDGDTFAFTPLTA